MVAAVARRSYVSIKRLTICFWSSNAKNMGLCLKVYPSIGKAWNQTRPFSINRVPCCWIIMEDDFQISLFIQHGQWCITFHLRCLQVFKISICSQLWQNIFIIGILLFWVWMLSSFCWWLWCMSISFWLAINTKIKIMTIEGTACCFDSNSGHFNRYATLLILVLKSLLSCQSSPNYCELSAYWHCSHQFETINYKLLEACH